MKYKEKQIEFETKKEIAKELDKVYPNAKFTNGWIAEVFYKLGYRKLPEGARVFIPDGQMVLLSREEYERLKDQANIKCDVENIREAVFDATSCVIGYKEAEKIYQRCFPDNPERFVKERKPSYNDGYFDGSKKTAEKFYMLSIQLFREKAGNVNYLYTPEEAFEVLDEIAKQVGVEIKE